MSLLFLTYGPTHSGKTTFGVRLRSSLGESAKFIHIDNDVVDEFIKNNYNNLRTDATVLAQRSPSDPDLRLLVAQLIAGYALRGGYSVIVTATHQKQVIRQSYYDIATKHGAQVILLIFRISDEQAEQRIQKHSRSTALLDTKPHDSVNFQELFMKHKHTLEEPTDAEKRLCFRVFEVTEDNFSEVLNTAASLVGE